MSTYKWCNTYLSCIIKIIVFLLQVVFVFFVSNIIQFTVVPSISTYSLIKINADTVRFHVTHLVTKTHCQNFNNANDVVYETSSIKCFFRGKLSALVCVREAFEIYKNIKKRKTLVKETAIRDAKMMITKIIVIIVMFRFSNEVKHIMRVSPSEYIYFKSSIHLVPFFSSISTCKLIHFYINNRQLSILPSAGNLQMAINFHKRCTYSKIPQKYKK